MTSEILTQLISNSINISSMLCKDKDKNINKNLKSNPVFDINAEKFVPLKEKLKQKNPQNFDKNDNELPSPPFHDYINFQIAKSYDNMLKSNIRSFNLYEKNKTEFKSLKLNVAIIELNFKFTCDYESIENEIKKFLELFGEINSLLFDVNTNSVKIIYKNDLSVKNVIHYLNKLLYENSINEEQDIKFNVKKENDINKNENASKDKTYPNEKQSEDIIKFINFLTDKYKNEENNINNENKIENKTESNEEKEKNIVNDLLSHQEKKKNSIILPNNKNISPSEGKSKNNDNNNTNYLYILENLETPEKKLNNINKNDLNNNNIIKQQEICKNHVASINPFNPSLKTPLVYVPFVPKINIGVPISIPVLLPINSTLLNKSFKDNAKISNPKDGSEETSINSCLLNQINKDKKINNNNSKIAQDDTQIKEIFEHLNNKIAVIENNNNDINISNNSKEENKKTSQEFYKNDNDNDNFIDKKEFTDKKEEIYKNAKKNLSSMFKILLIPNFSAIQNLQKTNTNNDNIQPMKPNPIEFNKNVIDFNKLTLETKNRIHFMTHSSRNYNYKYVCNYAVQIENDNMFMVTKRIIGKNGCFLKKILQESCIKYGDYSTKIRLRGKGSGYVDKGSNSSCDNEPLTLSVSSLNYPTYYNCCLLIDNLLKKIYDDYFEYLHKILPKEIHYSISKKKLIKSEFIVDRVNSVPFNNSNNDKSNCDEQNKIPDENEMNNKNNEDEK